jgi:hypothetical protein
MSGHSTARFICLTACGFAALGSAVAAERESAVRYSGSHAGGPANGFSRGAAPSGSANIRPVKVEPHYSGSYAGGPNNGLSRGRLRPLPVTRGRSVDPAYAYSGSHSGGPANGARR